MNHIQRHIVGYATILGAMCATALEQLKAAWPASVHDWTLFALEVAGAGFTTVIAYRSVPREPVPPKLIP